MENRKYKKRQSNRVFSIIMIVLLLMTNFMTPVQTLAESGANDTIESEGEVIADHSESTEPELDIEDATEDTSVDEVSDDSSSKEENTDESVEEDLVEEDQQQQESDIPKEQEDSSSKEEKADEQVEANTDAEAAENGQEELQSSSNRNVVTVFSVEELTRAIGNADMGTPTTILLGSDSEETEVHWDVSSAISVLMGKDIAIQSRDTQRFILRSTATNVFTVGIASLTLGEGVTVEGRADNNAIIVNGFNPSKLTINKGAIVKSSDSGGNAVSLNNDAKMIINDGTISGVVLNSTQTQLVMNGGAISNSGTGVEINSGTFWMYDGTISHNSDSGVKVNGSGTFNMYGGEITNNSSTGHGGGIRSSSASASIRLEKGTIANNSTSGDGGGLYVISYNRLNVYEEVEFSGNQANFVIVTANPSDYTLIQSRSASVSIYGRDDHPLNNYDIVAIGSRAYALSTAVTPEGEGGNVYIPSVSDIENTFFLPNTDVEIEAVADNGFLFQSWSSTGGGAFVDNSKAETMFTMPNNDTMITANFESEGRRIVDIFSDENLAQVVADYFDKGVEDYVTDAELLGVETIGGNTKRIQSLEGIEELQNLSILQLGNNQIEDVAPISSLTKLRTLYLTSNKISDISPVENLANLESLQIEFNQIEDIAPISSLTKLRTLYTANNKISDISPLANLTNLESLVITNNQIEDIAPIASLTKLSTLLIGNNKISDISPLANLTNLVSLSLINNQIEDIAPISSLTKLRNLYLTSNKISDISPVENLANLESLQIEFNQIEDIAPISSLNKLRILYTANNKISDLRPLESIVLHLDNFKASSQTIELETGEIGVPTTFNLYDVDGSTPSVTISAGEYEDGQLTWDIAGNNSATWTGSNGFTGTVTQTVVQGGRQIADIFPDENLAEVIAEHFKRSMYDYVTDAELLGVESVMGDGRGIQSLEGVENLKNVHLLELNHNQIEDLTPLSELAELRYLYLTHNNISDITPIVNLDKISVLFLGYNRISDIRAAPIRWLDITFKDMGNQEIQLKTVEIGVPTKFTVYEIDGTTVDLQMPTEGEYKDGQLVWNVAGNNSASWDKSNELNFSGTVTQTVVPGTTLRFESVPDAIEFEEAPIQNNVTTIKRKEANLSLSVWDNRGENNTWRIQASVDSPLTSEDGRHRLPDNALVFKNGEQMESLTNVPMDVYSGKTTTGVLTTEISWEEDEGILIHMQPIAAKLNTAYETTITWTLQDAP